MSRAQFPNKPKLKDPEFGKTNVRQRVWDANAGENGEWVHKTVSMWRLEISRTGERFWLQADLPIGPGINQTGQPLEYINMGWISDEQYQADRKAEQAEGKRQAAIADADSKGKGKKEVAHV